MLEHGGRRRVASERFGIPESAWLDLSTGINPRGYPVPVLPAELWNRLPEDDDGLMPAAARFYGTPGELLALAGSQAGIQILPTLFPRCRVAVLQPSYAEHRYQWQRAGHQVQGFAADLLEAVAGDADVVVLCNPNNPDGQFFSSERLLAAATTLALHGGHLVVDEAFIDATPNASVIAHAGFSAPNLIVLRSLGKFFGLAGARVGFVAASLSLRQALVEALGPWAVAGPSRTVARLALEDSVWQDAARRQLAIDSQRLAALLAEFVAGAAPVRHPLFVWLATAEASSLADRLARRGILVRHFDSPECGGLRVGLPGTPEQWQRLLAALKVLS